MTYLERNKIVESLRVYADLEDSEWGECARNLCSMASRADSVSENFRNALDDELVEHLEWAIENFVINEVEETYTETHKVLEFVGY